MEEIVILNEGIGLLTFVCVLAASATFGAYALLRRGLAVGTIALLAISYAWVKYVGGDAPANAVFIFWFIMNWVHTLAFIGLLRVSAMMQSGRLRLFGSDLIAKD